MLIIVNDNKSEINKKKIIFVELLLYKNKESGGLLFGLKMIYDKILTIK